MYCIVRTFYHLFMHFLLCYQLYCLNSNTFSLITQVNDLYVGGFYFEDIKDISVTDR